MTTGPTDEESTTAAGGPGGMPSALRLSEVLGSNAQTVARKELSAALDTSGSVVLIDRNGDIVFYATDGKMQVQVQVQRRGRECDACIAENFRLAEAVAAAWNSAGEAARLRAVLERIGEMNPETDSIEGNSGAGLADCFYQAQNAALQAVGPNVKPSGPL